jgi:omega-hydroxy-beta-dihydromenaquinone-9 sulfotransferase
MGTPETSQQEVFPRPKWNQAAVWTGADFFGLARLLFRNRLRIQPAYLADCMLDVWLSLFNTGLAAFQSYRHGPSVSRTQLQGDPVFIIGHWRTGTTLLHELFALDRQFRCPTTYECFSPCHFVVTEPLMRWSKFLLPGSRPTDNMQMGWNRPQEDEFALCNLGIPSPYATMAFPNHPPQYPEYLDLEGLSELDLRRWKQALLLFLKQLTYKRPGRLVLKSPTHTCRLPVLLKMFPKACFINMVRNPYVVFQSTVRLWKSLYAWQGYQKPTYEGLEERVFRTFSHMHERLEATRRLVDPARFVDFRYEDLVRDPVCQVRGIYERLNLGPFDLVGPAIRAYFQERKDYQTNRFHLPPELREEIGRRWRPYVEKYGYNEPG